MTGFDIAIFIIYLVAITGFGVSFYRADRTVRSFTLNNQNVPSWVVGMSIFATFVSSISYLALPGSSYMTNWNAFVFSLSIPIAAYLAIRFFIPVYRQINSPSAYTYLEYRFGSWASIYVSICYLLTQLMRVATILFLLALALNTMTGWNMITAIIGTGLLVAIYTLSGGIAAVVWTDAIQGIILIAGALFTAIYLLDVIPGGLDQIRVISAEGDKFSLGDMSMAMDKPTFWVVLIYGIFINLQNFGIDQNYVQRYMTARTEYEAKKAAFMGGILYIPVSALFLFIGTALYSYYNSGQDVLPAHIAIAGDRVFPYFIANALPSGFAGLLLASIFAAGMSTISTSINSSATVILTNHYPKMVKRLVSESESLRVLYWSSAVMSVLCIIIGIAMIDIKSALDAWWKLASIFSGGMLGLFLLAIFTRSQHIRGSVISVVIGTGLICYLTLAQTYFDESTIGSQLHTYLTIIIGTSVIFLTGFLINLFVNDKLSE